MILSTNYTNHPITSIASFPGRLLLHSSACVTLNHVCSQ